MAELRYTRVFPWERTEGGRLSCRFRQYPSSL